MSLVPEQSNVKLNKNTIKFDSNRRSRSHIFDSLSRNDKFKSLSKKSLLSSKSWITTQVIKF